MSSNDKFVVRDKVFFDIGDYMNTVKFKIRVPIYALPVPAAVKEKYFIPSFITDIDKNQLVFTMATISDMIDYANKSIMFTILTNENTLKVYEILVDYIAELNKIQNIPEYAVKFLKRANKFKTLLERTLDRLSNVDTNIKIKYKDQQSLIDVIGNYQ